MSESSSSSEGSAQSEGSPFLRGRRRLRNVISRHVHISAMCIATALVVLCTVVAGATYGGLAAHTVGGFEAGNTTWSGYFRLWLQYSSRTSYGTTVRVDKAIVRLFLEGQDVGTGDMGPLVVSPGKTKSFAGNIHAVDMPLESARPVLGFAAGRAINVTADLEKVTIWLTTTELPSRIRLMHRRLPY
eukprot:m51a1_g13979 hypothetical protein (187) ;mRNA; f:1006964-1007714